MKPEDAYHGFLRMAEMAVERNARQSLTSKDRLYQHEMYVKFTYHLASILTLERGSTFSCTEPNKTAYDYSSVIVLFRAALETYLAYFYLFSETSDQDERTFRFCNWMADGINQRQKVDVSFSADLQLKKAGEAAEIFGYLIKMQSTDAFHRLPAAQQHIVVSKRKWLRPGWAEILKKTGISEYWARVFYALFSAYAHTSSLSLIQFKEATVKNEGKKLTESFGKLILVVCAKFTEAYKTDFALDGVLDSEQSEMLESWIWVAKNLHGPQLP